MVLIFYESVMKKALLISCLCVPFVANGTTVYIHTDEEGHQTFTDVKKGADDKIELEALTVIPAFIPKENENTDSTLKTNEVSKDVSNTGIELEILSPSDGDILLTAGRLDIVFQLSDLDHTAYKIQAYMDEAIVVSYDDPFMPFSYQGLHPIQGSHAFQLKLLDDDEVIAESSTIKIHLKKPRQITFKGQSLNTNPLIH